MALQENMSYKSSDLSYKTLTCIFKSLFFLGVGSCQWEGGKHRWCYSRQKFEFGRWGMGHQVWVLQRNIWLVQCPPTRSPSCLVLHQTASSGPDLHSVSSRLETKTRHSSPLPWRSAPRETEPPNKERNWTDLLACKSKLHVWYRKSHYFSSFLYVSPNCYKWWQKF